MQFNPTALENKRRHLDEILREPERIARIVRELLPGSIPTITSVRRPWEPGGGASLFEVACDDARYFLKAKHLSVTVESKLEGEIGFSTVPSLRNEHTLLQRLAGLPGVPRVIGYREDGDTGFLLLEWLTPFATAVAALDAAGLVAVYGQIEATVRALFGRGLVHTDVHELNVMFRGDEPVLVDFEEAREVVQAEPFEQSLDVIGRTAFGDVGAMPPDDGRLEGFTCLTRLRTVFARLVRQGLDALIASCNFDSSCPFLTTLDHGTDERIYQSIQVEGVRVEGQRPPDDPRIETIVRVAARLFDRPFTHLDVGSNLGMFNLALAQQPQVRRSIGVEAYERYVALSRVLAFLANRPNADYHCAVAGEDPLVPLVGGEPIDLVTIYSVYHHIRDKRRFLDDLRQLAPAYVMLEMASQPECYAGRTWESEVEAIGQAIGMGHATLLGQSADYQRPIVLLSRGPVPADLMATPPKSTTPRTSMQPTGGPRVSIVLPTYNHGRFLPRAIESVLAQTFRDFELIIVNDGSTDDTRAVLDAVTDPRIVVIHQENRRLPTALNVGFARARGELYTWISADNYCAPFFLEALVGALDRHSEAGFAYSAFGWIDAADRIVGIHRDQEVSYRTLLTQNPGLASFLYRCSIQIEVGEYDPALEGAEDWDLWLRIAERAPAVSVPEVLYYYRLHADSMTAAIPERVACASRQVVLNALARAEHRLDVHQLYPTILECADRAQAEFVACLDFGMRLLQSPWVPPELAVPFLEAACERRAEPLAQAHLALASGRVGRWAEVRRLVPALRRAPEPALRELAETFAAAAEREQVNAFQRVRVLPLRREGIELFVREAARARVWSLTEAEGTPAPHGNVPAPTPPARGAPPGPREALPTPTAPALSGPAPGSPLVSVIVPTHNRPETLRVALQSILDQTFADYEIIVVNDAGTDVRDVLAEFAAHRRISYVEHAVNRGLAAARNSGTGVARGKYLAYLDDDDRFYPEHLETLVNVLERGETQVAYSDAVRVHQLKRGNRYVVVGRDLPYSRDFDRNELLVCNFFPVLCVMHRRSCVDAVGGFDESLSSHEDWDLWLRMSRKFAFVHVRSITAEFTHRIDGTSMTSSMKPDFLRTMDIVHARYAADVAGRPDLLNQRRRLRETLQQRIAAPSDATPPTFDCSIIVPVHNRVELTEQCLQALATVTEGASYEVVVVDDGSTDATGGLLAALGGDVQIVRNDTQRGFTVARNQGARVARGRHLVFLDHDTVPQPGWLPPLLAELDADPRVVVVGSKLVTPRGAIQHAGVVFERCLPNPYHAFRGVNATEPCASQRRELNCVSVACMAVRRDAFTKLGGFDEGYRNGFAAVDFCLRIRERGNKVVYQPASTLVQVETLPPGRGDHDRDDPTRLFQRWGGAWWWIGDEDVVLTSAQRCRLTAEDGAEGVQPITDPEAQRQWNHVAALQRALQADDRAACAQLLADPTRLPRDGNVHRWATAVAERLVAPNPDDIRP